MINRIFGFAKKLFMTKRVYELAKKKFLDNDEWCVSYVTNTRSHKFEVGVGVAHGSAGYQPSVKELLSDAWRNHLRLCGALWLVPLLERFAAGEAITTEAVLHSYEQEHGHLPPFRDL